MDVLNSTLFLDLSRASEVSCRGERMHKFGGIVLDTSCGVWWMGGTALGNGDGFFRRTRGGSRGGGQFISVGLA